MLDSNVAIFTQSSASSWSSIMEVKCSFKKLVGGNCGLSKRYKTETNVIPLVSCKKDISGHRKSLGISDVESEIELILARASVFVSPPDLTDFTVCPAHRYSLGIGWRRGSHRCRVPAQLCKHGKRAKPRKADRGIRKALSNIILRNTGIFFPVCSGMYVKIYFIFRFGYFLCIIEKETERFRIVNTFRMTGSTSTVLS